MVIAAIVVWLLLSIPLSLLLGLLCRDDSPRLVRLDGDDAVFRESDGSETRVDASVLVR
jgi:hypothetical protein